MKKEELYTEEGLFITELKDDFFEKCISENEGLESFISKLSDDVIILKEQENSGIWHCIFEVLIKELWPKEFERWHGYNPEEDIILSEEEKVLKKIVLEFYNDPFFITFDIAQKLAYNLYRLDKNETYDFADSNDREYLIEDENIYELLSIGRKKYGKDKNKNKNIADNLIDDLNQLWKENIEQKPPVYFPMKIDRYSITLELNFLPLNILMIGNEKFQNFLYHKKNNPDCFGMLMEQIQILNDKDTVPLQYIWEKMTGFNTTNVIAKFLMTLIKEERKNHHISQKDIEETVENIIPAKLFYTIRFMPNVLTKVLMFKTVFNYIGRYLIFLNYDANIKRKEQLENSVYLKIISSDNFVSFLNRINNCYKQLQEDLLSLATILRWYVDKRNMNKWIDELEEEYPMDLFKILYISLNINDDLFIRDSLKEHKQEEIDLNKEEYKCLIKEYKYNKYLDIIRKCKLLNKFSFKMNSGDSEKLAKELYQEGWGTLDECIKKIENESNSEGFIQWDDSLENIKENIKYHLLSDYDNIIFENTETEDEGLYKKIMNYLLNYKPSPCDLEEPKINTKACHLSSSVKIHIK